MFPLESSVSEARQFIDLLIPFQEINCTHFDAFLDPLHLHWNSRLRSSAGRFIPGSRIYSHIRPKIEIASYLMEEANAMALIRDTLAHEMIHYWLWVRRKPYGHTPEFIKKMKEMGVSRYNQVPRTRPYKYVYQCNHCEKTFPTRKILGVLACAACCKKYSGGKYDARFNLRLDRRLKEGELVGEK
jgi:predicted SprT family Zn-dependent metalloprotease